MVNLNVSASWQSRQNVNFALKLQFCPSVSVLLTLFATISNYF